MEFTAVIKLIAILSAALITGNWFLAEVKKARAQQAPWYQPYISIPGIIIILVILLPVIISILK